VNPPHLIINWPVFLKEHGDEDVMLHKLVCFWLPLNFPQWNVAPFLRRPVPVRPVLKEPDVEGEPEPESNNDNDEIVVEIAAEKEPVTKKRPLDIPEPSVLLNENHTRYKLVKASYALVIDDSDEK
jgi:hypothetical protein